MPANSSRTVDPGYVSSLGERMVTLERENKILRDKLGELSLFVEDRTTQGNAAKAERDRAERKARNLRVNAAPVADYIAELEAARPVDRASFHTPPDAALRMARECVDDRALLARLFGVLGDLNAASVAFALYSPPKRTAVTIPAGQEREVFVRDARISDKQAEECAAVGLPVEYRRVSNGLGEQPHVPGVTYHHTIGWREVLPTAAVVMWRKLSPSFDALIARGSLQLRELSDEESRAVDRAAWERAGSKRADLPKLA